MLISLYFDEGNSHPRKRILFVKGKIPIAFPMFAQKVIVISFFFVLGHTIVILGHTILKPNR